MAEAILGRSQKPRGAAGWWVKEQHACGNSIHLAPIAAPATSGMGNRATVISFAYHLTSMLLVFLRRTYLSAHWDSSLDPVSEFASRTRYSELPCLVPVSSDRRRSTLARWSVGLSQSRPWSFSHGHSCCMLSTLLGTHDHMYKVPYLVSSRSLSARHTSTQSKTRWTTFSRLKYVPHRQL